MTEPVLPSFRYHPDPVATGAFEQHRFVCRCCEQPRTWVYRVVPYAPENLRDSLCPWCIADGSAAERFEIRFTDLLAEDVPEGVGPEVVDEIVRRTPGFAGWDRERWLFCCGDGARFLGPVGWAELEQFPKVSAQLRADAIAAGMGVQLAEAFIGSLDLDGAATGYLFWCHHCERHLAYADADDD